VDDESDTWVSSFANQIANQLCGTQAIQGRIVEAKLAN